MTWALIFNKSIYRFKMSIVALIIELIIYTVIAEKDIRPTNARSEAPSVQ